MKNVLKADIKQTEKKTQNLISSQVTYSSLTGVYSSQFCKCWHLQKNIQEPQSVLFYPMCTCYLQSGVVSNENLK